MYFIFLILDYVYFAHRLDTNKESASNLSMMKQKQNNAIKLGIESALINGPNMGCPVSFIIPTI